jgi:CheY-like chemotaxis protein
MRYDGWRPMKKFVPVNAAPMKTLSDIKTLLYVEDEDANWEITMSRMKNRYRFLRARNSKETCELVRTIPSALSAILMDIQLQGSDLDGIQLTRLLTGRPVGVPLPEYAQNLPPFHAPIIFVTANDTRYGEETLLQAGGSLVVPKPVDFVKLTVGLNKILLTHRPNQT